MKHTHIWVGRFANEQDFISYIDQTEYLKAWAIYDNTPPTGNPEEDKEPSPDLRCDFCKEINIDNYDESLSIIKYDERILCSSLFESIDKKAIEKNQNFNTEEINACLLIDASELSRKATPEKAKQFIYLGKFNLENKSTNTQRDEDIAVWAGLTNKTEKEFAQYFEGAKSKSPFAMDTNLKRYKTESLKWYYFKTPLSLFEIKKYFPIVLAENIVRDIKERGYSQVNALIIYDMGVKGNQELRIFLKKYAEKYPIPTKFELEKDNYNGLNLIGKYLYEY